LLAPPDPGAPPDPAAAPDEPVGVDSLPEHAPPSNKAKAESPITVPVIFMAASRAASG
jgi:hypothetical protein